MSLGSVRQMTLAAIFFIFLRFYYFSCDFYCQAWEFSAAVADSLAETTKLVTTSVPQFYNRQNYNFRLENTQNGSRHELETQTE